MSEQWDAFSEGPPPGMPWGINFGGGANSTALLLFCFDKGTRPDWVVFSDTGSERPETYANVEFVAAWCKSVGFPFDVTRWIRKDGTFESIHENCLRTGYLPSKAYGYSGCTFKWKIQPLQRWRKEHGFTPSGIAIGYDAGESRRLKNAAKRMCQDTERDSDEVVWYPLAAWGINREECESRIIQHGWVPVKSSCYCCPNMKPREWVALKEEHPDLYQSSIQIQENAEQSGNARTRNLFRSYDPTESACVCSADGCMLRDDERYASEEDFSSLPLFQVKS